MFVSQFGVIRVFKKALEVRKCRRKTSMIVTNAGMSRALLLGAAAGMVSKGISPGH